MPKLTAEDMLQRMKDRQNDPNLEQKDVPIHKLLTFFQLATMKLELAGNKELGAECNKYATALQFFRQGITTTGAVINEEKAKIGLNTLSGLWDFLNAESDEQGRTNYDKLTDLFPDGMEGRPNLDEGLDALNELTGLEPPREKNPYLEQMKAEQESLNHDLYGTGANPGYMVYADPDNNWDPEFRREGAEAARKVMTESLAKIIALHALSNTDEHAKDRRVDQAALDKLCGEIKKDSAFKMVCTGKLSLTEECCKDPLKANEMMEKARQIAKKKAEQTKPLVEALKSSTSKSFAGRLKSWFVGNSKEYNTALQDMEAFANGKGDVVQAVQSVKKYLNLRKDKVRDHQYGRDRFDTCMKFLRLNMTKEAFAGYCASVDRDRKTRDPFYKGKTDPEQYELPQERQQPQNTQTKQEKQTQQQKVSSL